MLTSRKHRFVGAPVTVTASGTTISNAAAIPQFSTVVVAGGDGSAAVRLPQASGRTLGLTMHVYFSAAGDVVVFPPANGTINGGSANASITVEGKTLATFVATDATNWAAQYTTASG